jgi:hypothetical protein
MHLHYKDELVYVVEGNSHSFLIIRNPYIHSAGKMQSY